MINLGELWNLFLTVMIFAVVSVMGAMFVVDYALAQYYRRKREFLQDIVRAGLSHPDTTSFE